MAWLGPFFINLGGSLVGAGLGSYVGWRLAMGCPLWPLP